MSESAVKITKPYLCWRKRKLRQEKVHPCEPKAGARTEVWMRLKDSMKAGATGKKRGRSDAQRLLL